MPKRKTIILLIVIAIISIIMVFVLREMTQYNLQREEFENKTYETIEDFATVQEVAQFLDCEYIREVESPNDTFNLDIYLTFKYDLYTDGASNQEYYYTAAILFAQVTGYQNIRIIDDSKELVVAIIGDSSSKKILKLYINGNDNYYGEKDTIEALETYKETNVSRMEIQSSILKELLEKSWKTKDINFGTRESTFDGYDIYFDEGIELKIVGTKVFNIVFTEKYTDEIVSGIKVNTAFEEIAKKIGTPSFGKTTEKIMGYKGENLYIFFRENKVSIYPVEKANDEQEFLTLLETFRQTQDLRRFISGITDLWPDYDKYEYDSTYVDLVYTLRGAKFEFNTQRDNGVIFYNNYNGSYISDLRNNKNNLPNYTYFVDSNLVYENEMKNNASIHNYKHAKSNYDYIKYTMLQDTYEGEEIAERYKNDSKQFFVDDESIENTLAVISIAGDYAPFEISGVTDNYFWIDDINIAYGIQNQGIYLINAQTQEKSTIVEDSNSEFHIRTYRDGFLYYDDKFIIYGLINEGVTDYMWLDETHLAYSIRNKGIYLYNVTTREKSTIIEGTDEFNLVGYQNGILYFDNTGVYYILY